jgi:hypothetical protein
VFQGDFFIVRILSNGIVVLFAGPPDPLGDFWGDFRKMMTATKRQMGMRQTIDALEMTSGNMVLL